MAGFGSSAVHVLVFGMGMIQYRDTPAGHPLLAKYSHLGNTLCWATTIHSLFSLSPALASVLACSTLPAVIFTGSFSEAARALSGGAIGAASSSASPSAGVSASNAAANPMTQAMVGFPALAGIAVVLARIASSYLLPESLLKGSLPHYTVALALIAAQTVLLISGAVCTLVYPAPIVASLMIGPDAMAKEAERMWSLRGVDNDRVVVRLAVPSLPVSTKMSDHFDFSNLIKEKPGSPFALPAPIATTASPSEKPPILDVAVFLKAGGQPGDGRACAHVE